jgi:N-acetylneuraminate synthase
MALYKEIALGALKLSGDRPYLIAEAGVNYENDLHVAMEMVEEAARAGADAIKFQSYKANTLASKNSPSYWDVSKESTRSQFTLFQKYDSFGDREYQLLADHAAKTGIVFLSTPFDLHFADILAPLMPAFKIASADMSNHPFLRHIAHKGKPILLSVGASTLGEVEEAIGVIRSESNIPLALLHCVLSYPTDPVNANLGSISFLQRVFPNLVIGYSDHVPPQHSCLALTTAWLLGARIIEKHFTLDKTLPGNDHYHAMDPTDIRAFREQCDFATNLIGNDSKEVLPCEEDARKHARRSLIAGRAFAKGETVGAQDIQIKRPGNGIQPRFLDLIVGSRTLKKIEEDEVLQWDMFIQRGP